MNNTYIPLWSLYFKEVRRFFKVGMQTIVGPAISSLLFFKGNDFVIISTLPYGFSVILLSCGSYQYSGNISDGIYSENKNIHSQQEYTQEPVYDKEIKNSYYQTVFSEKSMQ